MQKSENAMTNGLTEVGWLIRRILTVVAIVAAVTLYAWGIYQLGKADQKHDTKEVKHELF
jgi:hypothetical protein